MAGLLRVSEEGLKIIDMVRRNLGWNKADELWCQAALTSKATLKRFWAQQPIRREAFIHICKAVGVKNWQDIVAREIQEPELLSTAIADIPQEGQNDRTFPLPENLPPVRNWVQRTKEIDILKTLITAAAPPLTNESPAAAPPLTNESPAAAPPLTKLPCTHKSK